MKIIVGLGNPGSKYRSNRHNVGFMFVDYIFNQCQDHNLKFKIDKYSNSKLCILNAESILVKPQTFMNLSGAAVKKIVNNRQLTINNLYVVHDDLDIPLGKFRLDLGQGPRLHNGIESIEKSLQTRKFWRVRIGIDNRIRTGTMEGEAYVLEDFRPEEKMIVDQVFPKIWKRLGDNQRFWY